MIQEVTIIIPADKEGDEAYTRKEILRVSGKNAGRLTAVRRIKRSVDARRGRVKLVLRYRLYIDEMPPKEESELPVWRRAEGNKQVLIIGSGPAGLFASLRLLEDGIKPVIIERGSAVSERRRDIAAISTRGIVGEDSNYCFGEGGAGTFSDGKLYTRSNKRGDIGRILRIFTCFGADERILSDAHPHIGTDRLPAIVDAMIRKITECGGEVLFDTRCTSLLTEKAADGTLSVCGVGTQHTKTGEGRELRGDAVILATGHSAADIYRLLARTAPQALEAKTFAVGVRVEHPRELIDCIQYHGKRPEGLGAAEYRLTSQQEGRGVYSFCMCPGGFVVPSATEPESIVINGMSAAGRNSRWSNAAIVVETRPEDIPQDFQRMAGKEGCPALAGLYWRSALERRAWEHGSSQKAPAQRLVDFLAGRESVSLPATSYAPGVVESSLELCLPDGITRRLKAAFSEFGRSMKGFVCDEALLIASETRTSTPVRILRDKETCECTALKNLYPAGEGSGYAGGIVSSAMDGERVAGMILSRLIDRVRLCARHKRRGPRDDDCRIHRHALPCAGVLERD